MSNPKVTRATLIDVAKELNEVLNPDPHIKTGVKATLGQLTDEITEVAEELEDGDILTQSTVDMLMEMEVDVPAKIKIKGAKKGSAKKAPAQKGSEGKARQKNDIILFITVIIEKDRMDRKGIIAMCEKKFPDVAPSTFGTILSDSKNPKYNRLKKLVIEKKDGTLGFK